MKVFRIALLITAFAFTGARADDTHFTMESQALGDGWFQYRLSGSWNAFFSDYYDIGFEVVSSNFDQIGLSDGGSNDVSTSGVGWQWPGTAPRQFSHLVTAHSPAPFITTNAAYALFAAVISGWGHSALLSFNIVGYVRLYMLGPSETNDPLVTTSNMSDSLVIIPDPKIVGITPNTISVEWYTNCTMRIEDTRDGVTWSNVATFLHYSPVTTWTSPVPLEVYGKSFRAVLVSNTQDTNLLSRGTTGVKTDTSVPIVGVVPAAHGQVSITFAGTSGDVYNVSLGTAGGAVLDAATVAATNARTTILLNDAGTTVPVYVRAQHQ